MRAGRLDPGACGVASIGIAGAWFVAGTVVRDLAALNKRELLPWDYWGISRGLRPGAPFPEATAARIDGLAALTAGAAPEWKPLREAYDRDDDVSVPAVVLSFPNGVATEVAV